MARPKLYRKPTKLNLTVDLEQKRALFRMATEHNMSISQLVVKLAKAAARSGGAA